MQRSFAAPAATVWLALTSAHALTEWFWPAPSFGTIADVDLQVGGRYRIAGPRAGIAVSGSYTVVEPYSMLGFTWQWDGESCESLVSVELSGSGSQTCLHVTHGGLADDAAADNHAQGWADCLDRLPAWLEEPDRA
ncbi:MAG: SRPBCC family protein [Streptosporangiaceae bacterium]